MNLYNYAPNTFFISLLNHVVQFHVVLSRVSFVTVFPYIGLHVDTDGGYSLEVTSIIL